jgi:hypothetical protein
MYKLYSHTVEEKYSRNVLSLSLFYYRLQTAFSITDSLCTIFTIAQHECSISNKARTVSILNGLKNDPSYELHWRSNFKNKHSLSRENQR